MERRNYLAGVVVGLLSIAGCAQEGTDDQQTSSSTQADTAHRSTATGTTETDTEDLLVDNEDTETYQTELTVSRGGSTVATEKFTLEPDGRRLFSGLFTDSPDSTVSYQVRLRTGSASKVYELSYDDGSGFQYLSATIENGEISFTKVVA